MKVLRILPFLLICLVQITSAQQVWPGDVNNNGIVNEVDLLTLGKAFGGSGSSRGATNPNWIGQEIIENWAGTFPNGLNYAYADCNGDGRINEQDVKVIEDNFGFRHTDVSFVPDEILPGIPGISPSFEVLSDDLGINPNEKQKQIDLGLGNTLIPVDSITGISFLIKLDPNAYDVKATDFKFGGWFENGNIQVIQRSVPSNGRSAPGDFIVAYTVTDGIPISGLGPIGSIILSPSITELDVVDLRITIDSITMVDGNLNSIPVIGIQITPFISDVFLPNNIDIDTTICQGDTLVFNDQNLTTSGMYRDTFINQYSLDSFINLTLVVADTFHTEIDATLCQGQSMSFNGQSLDITGSYRDTLSTSNGCDSFLILNLVIEEFTETNLNENICQGGQFSFNGQLLTNAGMYRDTLINTNGCDSFLNLNLTVMTALETNLNQTICSGTSFNFNGQNLTDSGTYRDTLSASFGCDSVIVLNLEIGDVAETNLNTTLCEGNSILFNGVGLTSMGIYRDTLIGDSGCDSILILNLTVLPAFENRTAQTLCAGETVFFNGSSLSTSGTYHDTLTGQNGCDSLLTLDLIVSDTFQTVFNTRICEGASLTFNGQVLSTSGTYRDTLQTANGCDSILLLNLTVNDQFETQINETMCAGDTYFFNNLTLTNSGTYEVNLMAENGCDSVVILNLLVGEQENIVLQESICEGENLLFNQQLHNVSGTYFDTLQTVNGCDSFIQLDLVVLPAYETVIDTFVCPGDTIVFLNFVLTTETTYWTTFTAANGCDSAVVLNLIFEDIITTNLESTLCPGDTIFFNGQALTGSGNYIDTLQNRIGCDSIITLNLTMEPNCQTTNTEEILLKNIAIYPNPTNNHLFIDATDVSIESLQIRSVTGQLLYQQNRIPKTVQTIDLQSFLPGVYWVLLQTEYGLVQRKVVRL